MSYPSPWKKIKFGDIAKRNSVRIDNPQESEYERYVGLEHLDSGELVVKRWGSTKDVSSNMQIFKKNNILFARRNTYLRRVSVALFDGVCSGDIIVIEPILNYIIEGFLPIYMQFEEFENKVVAWSAGAFSKRIKWKQLSDFEIWIPSKAEQQKIVDVIWSVQENHERTEKLVQITEKLKKGLLEELLTKGIGHKKFKKTELGEIPEEWDNKTIFDAAKNKQEAVQTGPFGAQLHSCDYVTNGVPLILIRNIENDEINSNNIPYISEEKAKQLEKYRIQSGDIVFSRVADVGRAAVATEEHTGWLISGQMLRVRLNNQKINNDFIKYLIKTQNFKDVLRMKTVGSTRDSINTTILGEMPIVIPPIKEQREICGILNKFDLTLKRYDEYVKTCYSLKKKIVFEFLSAELLIPKEVLN